jgi:hypothetical protein
MYMPDKLPSEMADFFTFIHRCDSDPAKKYHYARGIPAYSLFDAHARSNEGIEDARLEERQYVPIFFEGFDWKDACRSIADALWQQPLRPVAVEQHITSSTLPFRITYLDGKKPVKAYLKAPSYPRVFGKALNNILRVDEHYINFIFSEDAVAVEELPGIEITDDVRNMQVNNRRFLEALVRANEFSQMICLSDIMDPANPNCTYDPSLGDVHFFDFDKALEEGEYSTIQGIQNVRTEIDFSRTVNNERYRMHQKARSQRDELLGLLRAIEAVHPNPECAHGYGANDMAELIAKNLAKIGQWQNNRTSHF